MKNNQTALIVSPYLNHLGGGERYMLTIAEVLEGLGFIVYFAWDDKGEIITLAASLKIKLTKPKTDPAVKKLYHQGSSLQMFFATRKYDYVFYLSDGSIPLLGGKHNFLHMQVPFKGVGGLSAKNQFKLKFINSIIVNSKFTKRVVDKEYGINAEVIYPPVDVDSLAAKKKHLILSVGRFEPSLNVKRQDVLIEAFKKLSPKAPDWKLVLAGAAPKGSETLINELKNAAKDLSVDILPNLSHQKLTALYKDANIYWHAAGFDIDQSAHPELVEHFGITTVEALAAGCIPFVVTKGGQSEIVPFEELSWDTPGELASKTNACIKNLAKYHDLASAINIKKYEKDKFVDKVRSLL